MREYVDAARAEGLRVGLYLSLSDWHHPDYPAFRDEHRPYRFGMVPRPTLEGWARYRRFLAAQLEELCTRYGRIDLLWFDGGWERTADEWDAFALEALARRLQPDVVLNDRLPGVGDFDTPEQFIPAEPPGRAWETCLTMNASWGWNPDDPEWKSARELVHALCEVAGRGGNLLLNVSPMGDGALPPAEVERLEAVAEWMRAHADAIHDTRPGLAPWQFYGPSTRRGSTLYLFCLARPYEQVAVRGLSVRRVRGVRAVGTGRELVYSARTTVADQLFNPDPTGELVIRVPEAVLDPLATVLRVDLDD